MTLDRDNPALPVLALIVASVLWASSFIALKVAFRSYDPMVVLFGRMLLASLCFLAMWRNFRGVRYRPGDWKPLLFMAFCEPCLYFVFESTALLYTDVSQAGMIVAMLPLMMGVGASIFLGEHLSPRTWAGFATAILGACWLSASSQATADSPNPIFGNFMEFVAMICATGYMITLKRMSVRYPPLFLTAIQAFCGTVFYLPLLFLPSTVLPTVFDPLGAAAILYLGVGITLGAYGLYNYGTSRIPASQASAFTNLIPVVTLVLGVALLNERLTATQYLASALVLLGVWLSQDRRRRGKAAA
ncbi:MAG: DMT family transporter [Desulfovibrionaceae bacterium]